VIYLSYAVSDKDFVEPLARALARSDIAVQRDVDCAAKIRKHFDNGPTRSVVIMSEDYLESGWTTVEYEEIVKVARDKRGVVAVVFLNLDRDRVGEAAARYENGCWDPSWFENEQVWLLDGRPSPEDAALRIAASIREGWGAVRDSPERDQVHSLAAENRRLKNENRSLKLENQSLRAEKRALEDLVGPGASTGRTVEHGAVISIVDNRFIHAHLEEIEQLIRRALERAEFNEGFTVDRPIWHTTNFGARLDDLTMRHVIAISADRLRAAFLCVPSAPRRPNQEETDVGWFVVEPDLPLEVRNALLQDVVAGGLGVLREAGFKRVLTNIGTVEGAVFLEKFHDFIHAPNELQEDRWVREL
jgi:hypothetical protein